ncbi:MAG: hypothetical protein WED04_02930 [Promethearchaeati archaeon SRVP18_Atabeyarchaeia-1]
MRSFFGIEEDSPNPDFFVERKFKGKIVCAVNFGSPQEQSPFCDVDKVQENIQRRIDECNREATSKPYILIIPFTMFGNRRQGKKINKACILNPIDELEKHFKVFIIYFRKTNTHNLAEKDALMQGRAIATIETTEQDYDKSSELEKVVREKILPRL